MVPKELELENTPIQLCSIRFPRLTREAAIVYLVNQINNRQGTAVCFPDMSTLNLVADDPKIGSLIEEHFIPFNDGAGLEIVAHLKGLPFVENLNGTDFVPQLFRDLPSGCKIYLVGSEKGIAEIALEKFKRLFPHLNFLGSFHGYLSEKEDKALIEKLEQQKPDIILVGMGNPLQLQWIHKNQKNTQLSSVTWLAVGGLFDFYGGIRKRAPQWMRTLRLEWLHIVWIQPKKIFRYFIGIPRFLWMKK